MPQAIKSIVVRNLDRGMADEDVVADSQMPSRQMRLVQNMDTDSVGRLTGRKGYTRLGNAAVATGNTGLGLFQHIGTNSKMIAFINNVADSSTESYYLSGTSWVNQALGFTPNYKVRAISFLDYVIASNGLEIKSWNGTGAWGTTNLTSAPAGQLIGTYKQQVFIGNTSTDKWVFSSVPNSTGTTITWPTDNNFFVNPNDGANSTACIRYASQFLICKDNFIYRFNGRSIDPDPVIKYGVSSQEAIVESDSSVFGYDGIRSCIFQYSGGYPEIISKPIRPFLEAVPSSSYRSVCLRADQDHIEAFLGDLTVHGVALANVSARYTISTQTWVVRSYADEFSIFADYNDGTVVNHLGFTTTGSVMKMDNGTSDNGTAISYDLQTAWLTIGDNPSMQFTLGAFATYCDQSRGMQAMYKTNFDPNWKPIGMMREYVNAWSGVNIPFNRIKFRFVGQSVTTAAIFEGYAMLIPVMEGIEAETLTLL